MEFLLAELNAEDLAELSELMRAGKVTPVIDRRYALRDAARGDPLSRNRPRPRQSHHQHRFLREPSCGKRPIALAGSSAVCCSFSSSWHWCSTCFCSARSSARSPGWIVNAAAQPLTVSWSVVLALVADAIWLAIAIVAYPLLRPRELADGGRFRGADERGTRAISGREQPFADIAFAEPGLCLGRHSGPRAVRDAARDCSGRHAIGRTTRT